MAERISDDEQEPSLAYLATLPGEYGVIVADEEFDVYVPITRRGIELMTADGRGGGDEMPEVEATLDDVLRAARPCLRTLLNTLSAELLDADAGCCLVRLTLSAAAQEQWSEELSVAADLPTAWVELPE